MTTANHAPAPTQTIGLLLQQARYTIKYYQRQYVWEDDQVSDLLSDLLGEFRRHYHSGDVREDVANYGMYFLGPITLMKDNATMEIIDGQQRITSIILLLIALHHRFANDSPPKTSTLPSRIYNERFGNIEFVLQAADRQDCLESLLATGTYRSDTTTASNARIVAAYALMTFFLAKLSTHEATLFADWVLERSYVLSIETDSGRDPHTIFLTMNDRGQRLTDDEKLKAYLLSALPSGADRSAYSDRWQRLMDKLDSFANDDYDSHNYYRKQALVTWLRAQYATGNTGPRSDFTQIGSQPYRWLRTNAEHLGLTSPGAAEAFLNDEFFKFLDLYVELKHASTKLTPPLDAVRYFARAYSIYSHDLILPPLLASVKSSDTVECARRKIRMVASYLDIDTSRRIWCLDQGNVDDHRVLKPLVARITPIIRHKTIPDLAFELHKLLDDNFAFANHSGPRYSSYNRDLRWVLGRLTECVQVSVDGVSIFDELDSEKYQIEHLWSRNEEAKVRGYDTSGEFSGERNKIGCLIMLRSAVNQSLGNMPYEEKVARYARENVLAQTLCKKTYLNNPALRRFLEQSGLPFRAHERFELEDLRARQELYARLADFVWNPNRIDREAAS